MRPMLGTLVALIVGIAFATHVVAEVDSAHPRRFALAISGGASKGAYEAGLNWAILKLMGESGNLGGTSGGRIRPSEVASVAGASAGGINTILTAITWCARPEAEGGPPNRVDDNVFRDTWLSVDINELLPPQADSEIYLADDALFSRREYLKTAEGLRRRWNEPVFRVGCSIPMAVTVTRVIAQELLVEDIKIKNQRFYIPFELRIAEDGSGGYFFDPADYPHLSDPAMILMPRSSSAPKFSISDDRIIEAAVATSAFPTALGRRRFKYCRLEVGSVPSKADIAEATSDTDLVCPRGYALDEAVFADGGLFDNIPIGLSRILAESDVKALKDPYPVTYLFVDPDRVRYKIPEQPEKTACASDNPPEACRIMEFSFFSESRVLRDALGSARKYELYAEVISEHWRLNLPKLGYELADDLEQYHADFDCRRELDYFDTALSCAERIRRSGRLLEIAYDRAKPVITPPYSADRLAKAGVAGDCVDSPQSSLSGQALECSIHIEKFRDRLAAGMMSIITDVSLDDRRLYVDMSRSQQSIHNDRKLAVSSRGGPITGTLLGDFGGFLDYKFREYDYFVGVYDAIVISSRNLCALHFPPAQQPERYRKCVDVLGEQMFDAVGVDESARAHYVFARLAEREFGKGGLFSFAYAPTPPVDRDMQIIHDALGKALDAGEKESAHDHVIFLTEHTFFDYLKAENFVPTRPADGAEPLLTEIIADPDQWPTELTRRYTARLVYLERQAANLYAEREPDPKLREEAYTTLMGTTAHVLQTMTYRYPTFTFAPSTAPEDWIWRYVIPYELSWDVVEGDILVTWQPTMAMSEKDLIPFRASLGFAGGLFRSNSSQNRENYLGLGVGYTRRTDLGLVSSLGFTADWYHKWSPPEIGNQDTAGGEIFASFLKERLRVAVGTRDVTDFNDEWFLTFGFTDVPGALYWLTR